jgi:carboxymethylenebutenolidase
MTDFEQLSVGEANHRAFVSMPAGARAGVVVLHAWWGLNEDVLACAGRIADAGYAVIAPDMFGGQVASTIEDAERLSGEGEQGAEAIALAAVDELESRLGETAPLAILGFSFGAAYAILCPSERDRLVATVAYYGTYYGGFLANSTAAFLGHFAAHDQFEPEENVQALERGLRDAGRDVTIHRYAGTGHWFAEPSRPDAYNAEAAELAFERTVAFLNGHLRTGGS